nr:MAG TPA: hypothetical protein [Caudoviricetes sp.]
MFIIRSTLLGSFFKILANSFIISHSFSVALNCLCFLTSPAVKGRPAPSLFPFFYYFPFFFSCS